MNKNYFKAVLVLFGLSLSACHSNLSANAPSPLLDPQSLETWPTYKQQNLSGQLFGETWTAQSAVVRQNLNNPTEFILEISSEAKNEACDSLVSHKKSFATLVIPKDYKTTEYKFDLKTSTSSGNPLVFISAGENIQNLIAEKTSLRIDSINSLGFTASLTAEAVDEQKKASEINGQIAVTDCTKNVPFSELEQLVGNYSLNSFDGIAQNKRPSFIKSEEKNFSEKSSLTYKKSLQLSLYYYVSENSEATYNFGPIDGFGITTKTQNAEQTTYHYTVDGPINYRGVDITLKLDLTMVKSNDGLTVNYTIEIPDHIKKTSHNFLLKKDNY